jgi:hypothetical protein
MRSLPPQLRTFTAALLAALWALTPVLFLAHGEHVHRYCAEHRTFEEAGEAGRDAAEDAAQEGLAEAMPRLAAGGEHVGCPLLRTAERVPLLPALARVAAMEAVEVHGPVAGATRARSPLAVLDTAPKASPPAV